MALFSSFNFPSGPEEDMAIPFLDEQRRRLREQKLNADLAARPPLSPATMQGAVAPTLMTALSGSPWTAVGQDAATGFSNHLGDIAQRALASALNNAQVGENSILDYQRRKDQADYEAHTPRAYQTSESYRPANAQGGFGQTTLHSTPIFDDTLRRQMAAEGLQQQQLASELLRQRIAQDVHRQNALEMAKTQHGYDMEKLQASLAGHLQQAQINNPTKAQASVHLAQKALADINNPNLPEDQKRQAIQTGVQTGVLSDVEEGKQRAANALYNSIAFDENAKPRSIDAAINVLANKGRMPHPEEMAALYKFARDNGVSEQSLQKIIHSTLTWHGLNEMPTTFGTAQATPFGTGGFTGAAYDVIEGSLSSPLVAINAASGMTAGDAPSNRIIAAQFLKRALTDPEARRQFEKTYGVKLP